MRARPRRQLVGVAAALALICTACSDPHSGDWSGAAPATPSADGAVSATPTARTPEPTATPTDQPSTPPVTPLTALERWLLDGFQAGGYAEATVRVHGSEDAWVAGGHAENAPERFAHAWPAEQTGLYADDGTVLRTAQLAGLEVQVLQHVWGVSARFECGEAVVDTYAQSQVEQNQAEAEALSLAETLIVPLGCAEDGFQR